MRRPRIAAIALAALVVAAGCSDDSATSASTSSPSTAAAVTTTTAAVEKFTGSVDDFYVVPDPLPPGAPGTLIRTQVVREGGDDFDTRIMYHSVDGAGRDRAVTGKVSWNTAEAPEKGWSVVTIAPGTVGLASMCALSRSDQEVMHVGPSQVRVMTDYIGMGPVGETMPYLSRLSEGHSVLDAARAARHLVGEQVVSHQLVIFGHSQGGHGAESAHELAASYAPEFDHVGTVSLAPAAMFERTYGGVDDIVSRIVSTMSMYGLATEHPEVDPASHLSPGAAAAMASVKDTGCVDEIINALVPFAATAPYWAVDPFATEPAKSIMLANDVGNDVADAPLLLIGGTEDERVVEARVRDLFTRLCDNHQSTELVMLDGANHGTEISQSAPQVGQWVTARLAGEPATNGCP